MTGLEIKAWREKQGLSLKDMGAKLGEVSDSTVNRWEKGDQEIPGPAKLLLEMLIHGKMPFEGIGPVGDPEKEAKHLWQLRLTLEDWHKLEGLAASAGYADTKDYILSLIQEDLNAHSDVMEPSRTSDSDDMDDMALLADRPTDSSAGADSAVQAALETAARAFLAEPPGQGAPAPKRVRYTAPARRGSRRSSRGLSD